MTALVMAIVMLSVAASLSSMTHFTLQTSNTDFRSVVTWITTDLRKAVGMALADVSKELDLKASVQRYELIVDLADYPQAQDAGHDLLTEWQRATLKNYYGLGLELTVTPPSFACSWNATTTYSAAAANLSLGIQSSGFTGWTSPILIELNLTVLDLDATTANATAFFFSLTREYGLPVEDLVLDYVRVLYEDVAGKFREALPSTMRLRYLGGGIYRLQFGTTDPKDVPPRIKLILQDQRGVVVSTIPAEGLVLTIQNDTIGPRAKNVKAIPNPTNGFNRTTLTVDLDDLASGHSDIVAAEYFVDSLGDPGTGTPMAPFDGSFDSALERAVATLNLTSWVLGDYTLYVRGLDNATNWGAPAALMLRVINTPAMHVEAIDMSLEQRRVWFWLQTRAVAVVTILDGAGNPVANAEVQGEWSGATSGAVSGVTDALGQVTFKSSWRWGGGTFTFTFTVTDVVRAGWLYDPAFNLETRDSITS
jgi:hypothetical protein